MSWLIQIEHMKVLIAYIKKLSIISKLARYPIIARRFIGPRRRHIFYPII